jgi:hypothetical protein
LLLSNREENLRGSAKFAEPLSFRPNMQKNSRKTRVEVQSFGDIKRRVVDGPESERHLPELVGKALNAFEKAMKGKTFEPTLAEYLKLLQFEREVAQEVEVPREITVTWVEPEADSSEE